MKVKELILKLQEQDPEALVIAPFSPCSGRGYWEEASEIHADHTGYKDWRDVTHPSVVVIS